MRSGLIYIVMLASLAATPSWAASRPAHKAGQKPSKLVPKLIQSCDAHKFETVVDSIVDGQPHRSKVRLCGVEGQSDAEWIDTLRDAIKKLDANKDMPTPQRDQVVTAIKAEIARLTILGVGPALPRRGGAAAAAPQQPLSRDYSMLPPLPPPREDAPSPAGTNLSGDEPAGRKISTVEGEKGSGQSPLMPPPRPAAPATPAQDAAPVLIPVQAPAVAPHLNFGCDTPGDLSSDAPCAEFERETTITVHAGEDIPAGTRLQFVRNDRPQADVPLGGLRRGGALRVVLPAKVCSGFSTGKLELRVVRDDGKGMAQALSTEGPYSLRC